MRIRSMLSTHLALLVAIVVLPTSPSVADPFGVAFFEGGSYPAHSDFRNHFRQQLEAMAPPGVEPIFVPAGFKSAEWDREKSRAMATELTQNTDIDLVIAIGPWTVEDLLEAGFDRPIVAVFRFDPVVEGLLDDRGRPIADNLTVRVRPNKLASDLRYLASLAPIRKLGVPYFPSSNEAEAAIDSIRAFGTQLGWETVTAEGYDNRGTYAFFKAYRQLAGKVDALYLPPLWGFDSDKTRQFYAMIARDNVPTFSSEGEYHTARGALAAGSYESSLARAHIHAWKVVQIMNGATPADLPVVLVESSGLVVNETAARQLGFSVLGQQFRDITVLEAPPSDDVERLTAVDAVNVALAQNPGYQERYGAITSAGHAASEAVSAYYPQLNLRGSAAHFDDNAVNNDDRYRADRYRVGLELQQELFALGAIRDIQLADLHREGTEIRLRQAGLDLELGVVLAFLNLVRAEQVRTVELAHRRQVRDCLQLARLRLELREDGAAEVWRWEQEWLKALLLLRQAERDREIARILLNTLMGRPGDYPFVPDWQHFTDGRFFHEASKLAQAAGDESSKQRFIELLLGQAMASNPGLSRSNLGLDIGKARMARSNAGFYPRVGFFATLDMTQERAEQLGFEEANPGWSVGAAFELPLFLGGRRFKERNRLQSELDELEYRRDQVALEVAAQLRVEVARMLSRVDEFPPAARAAELADQYFPEILSQAAAGERSITELLDAVHSDREASRTAIIAQIDYFQAVAQVIHTVGISPNEGGRTPNEELLIRIAAPGN